MTDETALLASIWEHPHEDTPRLVYADWLQENGQPERAEFIRVQCELAQLGEWAESPRKDELERREQSLWTKHAKAWKAGLPKLLRAAPFRRGFPGPRRRAVTGNQFLKLTDADLAPAPLWDFRVNQCEQSVTRVVASPQMSRVEILEIPPGQIVSHLTNRAAEVFRGANFPNLADLQLDGCWVGDAGVAELAANPSVRNLRALSVIGNNLTDAGVAALTAAPWFGSLRVTHLGNNPFGPAGLRTLVSAWAGGSLRELGLTGRTVGDERPFDDGSLAELCHAPHLAGLKSLNLAMHYFRDSGVTILCSDRTPFRLRRLVLDNNRITDRGAEMLAAWTGLASVETLTLVGNLIGRAGAQALAQSPHLSRIKTLGLALNPIADLGRVAQQPLVERFGDAVKFAW